MSERGSDRLPADDECQCPACVGARRDVGGHVVHLAGMAARFVKVSEPDPHSVAQPVLIGELTGGNASSALHMGVEPVFRTVRICGRCTSGSPGRGQ